MSMDALWTSVTGSNAHMQELSASSASAYREDGAACGDPKQAAARRAAAGAVPLGGTDAGRAPGVAQRVRAPSWQPAQELEVIHLRSAGQLHTMKCVLCTLLPLTLGKPCRKPPGSPETLRAGHNHLRQLCCESVASISSLH